MNEPARRLAALAAVLAAGVVVSPAADARGDDPAPPAQEEPPSQDEPKMPEEPPKAPPEEDPPKEDPPNPPADGAGPDAAPAEPAEAPPTDEEDAAARKVLAAAAVRQGGAKLAPPDGAVTSFRIVFGKVTVHRERVSEDGSSSRQRLDSEDPGLVVHWKDGQIKTAWRLLGEKPTTRALLLQASGREVPWLSDGRGPPTTLLGPAYANDRDEIERDRKIVRALLDVAVLRGLLADGSRWKVVKDPLHPGTAIRRTPPAGAKQSLRLTLWIDPKTDDVTFARLSPNERGESTMHYGFAYHEVLPAVKDGVLRFPFTFTVQEQVAGDEAPQTVLVASAREASFNDVEDAEFLPPKPR